MFNTVVINCISRLYRYWMTTSESRLSDANGFITFGSVGDKIDQKNV